MNRQIFVIAVALLMAAPIYAADDPLVSLFNFYSKVAKQGNVKAMMKLGRMYERGQGTKKDLDKALEMYQKAQNAGAADAAAAIKRVLKQKQLAPRLREIERKKQAAAAARKKAERERAAREKAARLKAAKEAAAKEKARRAAEAARKKAAREKALREKQLREQKARAARLKAQREQAERLRQQREAEAAKAKQAAQVRQAEKAADSKPPAEATPQEPSGFVSDPCDTPAGRFMTSCNKRKRGK